MAQDGRAFGGPDGWSRFTVTLDPANTGIRLTRLLDMGVARQDAYITVNGAKAGTWKPLPASTVYHWKYQQVAIRPTLTSGKRAITVKNHFVSSAQDFNEFKYIVDQRVGGRWVQADVVDVGPNNLDREKAHRYRINRQTWQGIQYFPPVPIPNSNPSSDVSQSPSATPSPS